MYAAGTDGETGEELEETPEQEEPAEEEEEPEEKEKEPETPGEDNPGTPEEEKPDLPKDDAGEKPGTPGEEILGTPEEEEIGEKPGTLGEEEAREGETETSEEEPEISEEFFPALYATGGFTPRLSVPTRDNQYYARKSLNPFTEGPHYFINNCTRYAFGRAYELLGYAPNTSRGGAGAWYGHNDGYVRSSNPREPKLGAIMCWTGHVAVVEVINGDMVTYSDSCYPFTDANGKYHKGWDFQFHTVNVNNITQYTRGQSFKGYISSGSG